MKEYYTDKEGRILLIKNTHCFAWDWNYKKFKPINEFEYLVDLRPTYVIPHLLKIDKDVSPISQVEALRRILG